MDEERWRASFESEMPLRHPGEELRGSGIQEWGVQGTDQGWRLASGTHLPVAALIERLIHFQTH